jgi:hypothetical protein
MMALFSLRAKGPLEALLRVVGLLLVVGLAVLGFWKNSERNMERLNARFGLSDEIHGLSADERDHVQAFIAALRKNYGIEARVRITRERPTLPEPDGKTLSIALCPDEKFAVVQLPALMARALGADFARMLVEEHFPFHFAPGKSWPKGLLLALDLMESRLASLGADQDTPPRTPAQTPTPAPAGADKDKR